MDLSSWIRYKAIPWHTGLGITTRTVTLEVPGRKTGNPIRTSLSRTDWDGKSYFVSLAGDSAWVRNVRAATGRAVVVSGRRTPVRLVEVGVEERPPVLLAYVQKRAFTHSGAQSARDFFGLGPSPTLEQMTTLADRFVVFRIERTE
jgi:hypothetical protein